MRKDQGMPKYSTFEQLVMKKLVESSDLPGGIDVLGNIWEDFFPSDYIVPLENGMYADIRIRNTCIPEDPSELIELQKQFLEKAYKMVRCFDKLVKFGLISLYGNENPSHLGELDTSETYINLNINDHVLIDNLRSIASKRILVLDDLREIVSNKFIDDEKKKEIDNLKFANITILIAVIGLAVSAIVSGYDIYDKIKDEPKKIIILDQPEVGSKPRLPEKGSPTITKPSASPPSSQDPDKF